MKNSDYTFKFNKNLGRHGWLRLTPAYSVKLVQNILTKVPKGSVIFEPFSGTATTGLVCAEEGYDCICYDINPFLIWLGRAKCNIYSQNNLNRLLNDIDTIKHRVIANINDKNWQPPLFKIERWWADSTLQTLKALRSSLVDIYGETKDGKNPLPWIAFCRLIIETSSAAFNHVSMSFKEKSKEYEFTHILQLYEKILHAIVFSSSGKLSGTASIVHKNSIDEIDIDFDVVITSPPYPNRMSYIRELRPYMYWTKYLSDAREAGILDWQAVGGTWGIATSNLNSWTPTEENLPSSFYEIAENIKNTKKQNAEVLSKYVFKYFHDMHSHFSKISQTAKKPISIHYIIGNSSFYGQVVDTPSLFIESLQSIGFKDCRSEIIRKRNSNKCLFEYEVSARLA